VALANNRHVTYKPSADGNRNIAPGANTERVNTRRIAKPANNPGYSYRGKGLNRRVNMSSVDGPDSRGILIFPGRENLFLRDREAFTYPKAIK
jgi:hypothetical protein